MSEKCNEFRDENLNLQENIASLQENLKILTDVNIENEKLKDDVRVLKSDLESTIKHRNKVEKVLKQASDALVMALSVCFIKVLIYFEKILIFLFE